MITQDGLKAREMEGEERTRKQGKQESDFHEFLLACAGNTRIHPDDRRYVQASGEVRIDQSAVETAGRIDDKQRHRVIPPEAESQRSAAKQSSRGERTEISARKRHPVSSQQPAHALCKPWEMDGREMSVADATPTAASAEGEPVQKGRGLRRRMDKRATRERTKRDFPEEISRRRHRRRRRFRRGTSIRGYAR